MLKILQHLFKHVFPENLLEGNLTFNTIMVLFQHYCPPSPNDLKSVFISTNYVSYGSQVKQQEIRVITQGMFEECISGWKKTVSSEGIAPGETQDEIGLFSSLNIVFTALVLSLVHHI